MTGTVHETRQFRLWHYDQPSIPPFEVQVNSMRLVECAARAVWIWRVLATFAVGICLPNSGLSQHPGSGQADPGSLRRPDASKRTEMLAQKAMDALVAVINSDSLAVAWQQHFSLIHGDVSKMLTKLDAGDDPLGTESRRVETAAVVAGFRLIQPELRALYQAQQTDPGKELSLWLSDSIATQATSSAGIVLNTSRLSEMANSLSRNVPTRPGSPQYSLISRLVLGHEVSHILLESDRERAFTGLRGAEAECQADMLSAALTVASLVLMPPYETIEHLEARQPDWFQRPRTIEDSAARAAITGLNQEFSTTFWSHQDFLHVGAAFADDLEGADHPRSIKRIDCLLAGPRFLAVLSGLEFGRDSSSVERRQLIFPSTLVTFASDTVEGPPYLPLSRDAAQEILSNGRSPSRAEQSSQRLPAPDTLSLEAWLNWIIAGADTNALFFKSLASLSDSNPIGYERTLTAKHSSVGALRAPYLPEKGWVCVVSDRPQTDLLKTLSSIVCAMPFITDESDKAIGDRLEAFFRKPRTWSGATQFRPAGRSVAFNRLSGERSLVIRTGSTYDDISKSLVLILTISLHDPKS